jgi:two-component system sensor histidine kinase YesM
MKKRLKELGMRATLVAKIRSSYLMILIPVTMLLIAGIVNMWMMNHDYEDMIHATITASEFNMDFKKDFDNETYLLIVGNRSLEDSRLDEMLDEANQIVDGLEEFVTPGESKDRLDTVKKYLVNLETYKNRIQENVEAGDRYEENIEIWENDVQIVTSLVKDAFVAYIYCEITELQQTRERHQEISDAMNRVLLVTLLVVLVLTLLLSYYVPLSISRPIQELSQVTRQVAKGDLTVRSEVRDGMEVRQLSDSMNAMIDKINELLDQVKTEQTQLRKAEFELLQSQINPHFLYNTLDAIIWLAEAGEQKKVVSMVGSLSEFFRSSLNQGKDIVTVREELLHVKSYLEIQQVRYQDILQYEIHVPMELDEYRIPKISIQPMVENALYHGIKNKRGMGHIWITGTMEQDYFQIHIRDDGPGIQEERLKKIQDIICNRRENDNDIFGIYNVNERIRLNFGEEYGLSLENRPGQGVTVSIKLPYTRA